MKTKKLHSDAYRKLIYESELGHRIEVWNSRNVLVPMAIQIEGINYQQIYFPSLPILQHHKPKDGDYIFTGLKNADIDKLVAMKVKSQNEKLATDGKTQMLRTERRDYEDVLKDHYLNVSVVCIVGKPDDVEE